MFDPKKLASPYYNPLKNYGEGVPMTGVSGPVQRYLQQQQQPRVDRSDPKTVPASRGGYPDSLEQLVGDSSKPPSRRAPQAGLQKGNSYQ
jgi:hypothetical protein